MLDNDFDRTKEYLKSKLCDYLKAKGINPNTSFRCLNPAHTDVHPSMRFNSNNNTVHCFACNATYNIFDLVGIDYNLNTFKERLDKLSQIYLGINNHNIGREKHISHLTDKQNVISFGVVNTQASNETTETTAKASPSLYNNTINDNTFKIISPDNHIIKSPMLNALTDNTSFMPQSAIFGFSNDFNDNSFSPQNSLYTNKDEPNDKNSYAKYLKQCKDNITSCDYFKLRGLSDEVIERFNLGFDEKFNAGLDATNGDQMLWKAVIIPYSNFAFMARNTDPLNKDRIRKKGSLEIFNLKALFTDGPVFITEGEFDALSLESLGYNAIALGGVSNVKQLLDKLASNTQNFANRILYITLDNDKAGIEATSNLIKGCLNLQIAFKQVNIAYPYKDINEALIKNRANLCARLENLEQFLTYKLPRQLLAKEQTFISNIDELLDLKLSNNVYVLSGKPIILRALMANIIKDHQQPIVYASNYNQWQLVCNNLEPNDASYKNNTAHLIPIETPNKLIDSINFALNAYYVQNITNITLMVDLCGYSNNQITDVVALLSDISIKYMQKILVITQEGINSELEGHALQVIKVAQNTSEIIFTTYDKQGQDFEFNMRKY